MSSCTQSVLSLWAGYWAAMFAQIAYLRTLDDGVGAIAFSWVSRGLLMASVGFFLAAKANGL